MPFLLIFVNDDELLCLHVADDDDDDDDEVGYSKEYDINKKAFL